MTKQDIPVESETAQSLAAQASKKGKTVASLTNEILDVALRIYGEGGNADEMFPAWKVSRMSRTLNVPPSVPGGSSRRISERSNRRTRGCFFQDWVEPGKNL